VLTSCTLLTSYSDDESPVAECEGDAKAIQVEGGERCYVVHVPSTLSPNKQVPLLLAFHGAGGKGQEMREWSDLDAAADRVGVVVAYLDAWPLTGMVWAVDGNTYADRAGIDDLGCVRDVIDSVSVIWPIDRERVYAVGVSEGGRFTHRLACQLSDEIAGIASVSATILNSVADACSPVRELSVLHFHGTNDLYFPWNGLTITAEYALLSVEETLRHWAEVNGCSPTPDIAPMPDIVDDDLKVERWDYEDCDGGAAVTLFASMGGRHSWPGADASADIDASQIIADFFDVR
jgi:polyhydroxybutyrate depolymerase